MRSTLFPTEPQKKKLRLPSAHVTSPKKVQSIVNRIMSNARFARPVPASWSQVVGDKRPKEFRLYPRRPRGRKPVRPEPGAPPISFFFAMPGSWVLVGTRPEPNAGLHLARTISDVR